MINSSWVYNVGIWGPPSHTIPYLKEKKQWPRKQDEGIDTVRYMRESLGHSKNSVWTVNPRYTSQTCHVCGERGVRVVDETSTTERKGGEYFYCSECEEHFHADINAARNIIHVQDSSVVSGRTKDLCPRLSTSQ